MTNHYTSVIFFIVSEFPNQRNVKLFSFECLGHGFLGMYIPLSKGNKEVSKIVKLIELTCGNQPFEEFIEGLATVDSFDLDINNQSFDRSGILEQSKSFGNSKVFVEDTLQITSSTEQIIT